MGRWSRVIGESFLDWLALPNGLRCLDVGCGNGAFTEVLIARGIAAGVVGIDPSDGQIAFARERRGAKAAEFRVGDAQALPFENDSFDAALMALVISFVPDPACAVAEMARVARPGGYVATYMWDIPNGGLPFTPLYRAGKSLGLTTPGAANPLVSRRERQPAIWDVPHVGGDVATRPRHPRHFRDGASRIGNEGDHQGHQGRIEAVVFERQRLCVTDAEFRRLCAPPLAGKGDLPVRRINPDDSGSDAARDQHFGESAIAAADVEAAQA